jgi:hypothetical protein
MNRKLLSTLTALLLVWVVTFSILSSCTGSLLGSGTSVGGEIASDTTWGSQGSPYNFQSDVKVKEGVTLTILPGTVVNLDLSCLLIDGTLNAIGSLDNRIKFEAQKLTTHSWPPRIYFNDSSPGWDESTSIGCVIAYAEITVPNYQYETIIGEHTQVRISNNIINNYGNDAAATRTNGLVTNNTILGGYIGVIGWANTTICYNTIKDADIGIACGYMSTESVFHPVIIGNIITNNTKGLFISGSTPYISYNTITGNDKGVSFDYNYWNVKPVGIINNNIYNNDYNVYVEEQANNQAVDVANNWWGTTDTSTISQKLHGDNIVYTPILSEATSNSPTDLPITLALTPQSNQYYAVAAFACGALVGVLALVIWIKKGKNSL